MPTHYEGDLLVKLEPRFKGESWRVCRVYYDAIGNEVKSRICKQTPYATESEAWDRIAEMDRQYKEIVAKEKAKEEKLTPKSSAPTSPVVGKYSRKSGFWQYDCRICQKVFSDKLDRLDDPVCRKCYTGGISNVPLNRGEKGRVIRKGEFPT